MSILQSIQETIGREPEANGLAIIISNDYCSSCGLPPLKGADKDGENMYRAFKYLKFATHWESNVTRLRLMQLIYDATRYCFYHQFENYRCIAFVFAGHGFTRDHIYMQDATLVSITDIVQPFLPKSAPHIGALPKLFLIDACRGTKDINPVLVPRGSAEVFKGNAVERGVTGLLNLRLPPESNYLIAYSTMPEHKSYEQSDEGSIWTTILAEKLCTSHDSIEDILTAVNEKMMEKYQTSLQCPMQQPEKRSYLNRILILNPDVKQKFSHAEESFCLASGNGGSLHSPQVMPYQKMLTTAASQTGSTDQHPLSGGSGTTITEPQLSSPMEVCLTTMPSPDSHGTFTGHATPNCFMRERVQLQLNSFCQTHGIKPQFFIIEDASSSSGQTRYKCTINYTVNGRPERINSTGYYASQMEAQEQTAWRLMENTFATSDVSSRGMKPTAKIWKLKLEEYCNRKSQSRVEGKIKYITKESPKNGFKSKVFVPNVGYVEGEFCRKREEAEQTAAYKVLQKLGEL